MGRFVGAVGYYGRYFRVLLYHFVIYIVKGHAVMDVAGGHFHVEHKAVDIACRMCFIGKLLFMLSLVEYFAFQIISIPHISIVLCKH